jgi:hypothetical protein
MASLVLNGNTSGSVTISSPAVSGTTTLTLPTTTGTFALTAAPTFTGQATIPTINLTGGQITFPATQSASADANTLDDYEEGTWTPVDSSGASLSFTSVSATYTKIGRIVNCFMSITYPTTANTSQSTIGGLPFASAGSPPNPGGGFVLYNTSAIANTTTAIGGTATQFSLYTTGGAAIGNNTMSTAIFRLAIVYQV